MAAISAYAQIPLAFSQDFAYHVDIFGSPPNPKLQKMSINMLVMSSMLSSLLLGITIGAATSAGGAFLSYWFGIRMPSADARAPLGYLILTVGLLAVIGVLAVIGSLLSGQSLLLTALVGIGIMIGFALVFAIFLFGWLQRQPE